MDGWIKQENTAWQYISPAWNEGGGGARDVSRSMEPVYLVVGGAHGKPDFRWNGFLATSLSLAPV